MKNKKLIKILVPLAVIIWGLIIYRVISFVNNGGPTNNIVSQQSYKFENTPIIDTFKLVANYRDPFNVQPVNRKITKTPSQNKSTIKASNKIKASNIKWPSIVYKGRVQDNTSSKNLSIMVINNHNYMMFESDEKEDVILKKIYKDSVLVEYSNQQKFIRLKSLNQ